MIKLIEFPDKSFQTKEESFECLHKHAEKIISLKKSGIFKSVEKSDLVLGSFDQNEEVKAQLEGGKKGYVYPVINTTKYMDSHMDVHFDGIWNKSIKDNKNKIYYVTDHELKIANVIAYPEDVEMKLISIPWKTLGKEYEGETEALVFAIDETKIVNTKAYEAIKSKKPLQNSVRMQYVKIMLGMNSGHPDHKDAKAYFDNNVDKIANKEKALESGYFWGVEEAKIFKEGSLVLFGSNDATPIFVNDSEPEDSTQNSNKVEPESSTQQKKNPFINPNLF